jgi:type 1 glutamine amidotransferase
MIHHKINAGSAFGRQTTLTALAALVSLGQVRAEDSPAPAAKTKVVLLTGANNHDWATTTPELERILEDSGNFEVDVVTDPEQLTEKTLAGYDVLLSNWNGFGKKKPAPWAEALKGAYAEFVRGGGGHVVVHAGSCSFYDWADYQAMGIATWKGGTGHKAVHEFEVRITDGTHPITRALEKFKTTDELWFRPFVQPDARVLAESFSKTTGNWEPTALVSDFGKGRCFTLLLGHDAKTMRSPGFRSLLLRGTAWAGRREPSAQPATPR